ncbi:hypothetical protein ABH995_005337 [Bradyrhizobium yuanmingense]|uniref:endo-1,3-alpha-glucanase family glycosylhydrolase n=1 Tax=Bradyrhizobium yuanmingense TaxID=108015 RepID=UPI003519373B
MEKEFALLSAAGINAIGLLISPSHLPNSKFAAGLHMVAEVAAHSNTKIILELWGNPWAEDYARYGSVVHEFFQAHPNAFVVRDEKPILVFAFDSSQSPQVHNPQTSPTASIADFLTPWGGRQGVYIMTYLPYVLRTALNSPIVQLSDAVDVWTPQDDWSARHSSVVFDVGQRMRKEIAFPVAPAFYQRRAGQPPMEYGNSFGAARYLDAWRQAIAKNPQFINIQTWNDLSEDSAVVPTNTAGYTWLHLTSYFTKWLADNHEPFVETERVMLFHPKQLVSAKLTNPKERAENARWRHGSPTVDYINVVTVLRQSATIRVRLGAQTWEKRVQAGLRDWVIYVSSSPEANAFQTTVPVSSEFRYVTIAKEFEAGAPVVEVVKSSGSIEKLTSKLPFLSSGEWQDFTIIADEIALSAD